MSYIGREPTVGNFQICDAISVVNGQAAYTMQVGSVNVLPETANHMIVSLNGVIQKPNTSFTVSGSTITFSSNLVTNDVIDFIQILGDVLDLGVPSDGTVTSAKITYPLTTFSSTGIDDNATSTAMTINSSENIGIGTANPSTKLHVVGDYGSTLLSGTSPKITVQHSGGTNQFVEIQQSGGASFIGTQNGSNDGELYILGRHTGNNQAKFSPNLLHFYTANTERVRIHSGGVMSAANGIALGVGTANTASNVLDDYEEGTFTPTIALGITSVGYSSRWGYYTKIGNTVSFSFNIQTNAGTLNSSRLKFGGLPFNSVSSVRGFAVFNFVDGDFINSKTNNLPTLVFEPNPTIETYFTNGDQFLGTDLNNASGNNIYIGGVYETA